MKKINEQIDLNNINQDQKSKSHIYYLCMYFIILYYLFYIIYLLIILFLILSSYKRYIIFKRYMKRILYVTHKN